MATTIKNKKIMEKKLVSLQKQVIELEKKLYPNKYSWRAFTHLDEPYLKFADHMVYPMELVSNIVKTMKKDAMKVGEQSVGLILELPVDLTPQNATKVKSYAKKKKVARKSPKMAKKSQSKPTKAPKSKAKAKKR